MPKKCGKKTANHPQSQKNDEKRGSFSAKLDEFSEEISAQKVAKEDWTSPKEMAENTPKVRNLKKKCV